MSKKTDSIYKSLENLDKIEKEIEQIEGDPLLKDIDFRLKQEIKTLTFWFDSLYRYNGKSTSAAKQSASAKNGCRGGRPPKAVTEAKKRINEINTSLIPSILHDINMSNSNEEISLLEEKKQMYETESEECKKIIGDWANKKQKT